MRTRNEVYPCTFPVHEYVTCNGHRFQCPLQFCWYYAYRLTVMLYYVWLSVVRVYADCRLVIKCRLRLAHRSNIALSPLASLSPTSLFVTTSRIAPGNCWYIS